MHLWHLWWVSFRFILVGWLLDDITIVIANILYLCSVYSKLKVVDLIALQTASLVPRQHHVPPSHIRVLSPLHGVQQH